ncbi:MAG: DAK2 domain-containing protein, partial [Nocardioidaceae bacterium]
TLRDLGDSLVVVGGERLWNVHVHVDDVGAAIEAGITAGRPYRIAVTHFADERRGTVRAGAEDGIADGSEDGADRPATRAVVATAAGPGLAALYREAGADVLEFRVGDDLSVSRMLDTIAATSAREVIVLPNSTDYVAVCEAAASRAREDDVRVSVVPTHTQVQGLSALAVHQPGRAFDDDVIAMTSAAGHTHHGAVTVAEEAGITMAGPCRPGDVLGVVEGEFAVVGHDQTEVALEVLSRLMSGSAELVTIVAGEGVDPGTVGRLEESVRASRPDVDSVVYDGGQQRYRLLLAAE